MPHDEEELLPISALQHLLFCERQCALIHVERLWADNQLTVEGQYQHRKVHEGPDGTRDGVRTVRGLSLRSLELGIIGAADVVEFKPPPGSQGTERALTKWLRTAIRNYICFDRDRPYESSSRAMDIGSASPDLAAWTITPVEYKRGRPKSDDCDRVQICAQAFCLEEMLGVQIDSGYLFYGLPRRRTKVLFDDSLRRKTVDAAARLHELVRSGVTPKALRGPKCDSCSLLDLCLPDAMGARRSANRFVDLQLSQSLYSDGPSTDFMENE